MTIGDRQQQQRQSQLCVGGRALIAPIWNAGLRQTVRSAFLATHLPYADKVGGTVVQRLDH